MNFQGTIDVSADLSAVLIHPDGSTSDHDCGKRIFAVDTFKEKIHQARGFWGRMWQNLRTSKVIPLALTFAAFMHMIYSHDPVMLGLVTTTGVNYMAADFASGGVTPTISGFKFHDSGTGVTAAAVGDTALQTGTGNARVSGAASNPSANIYQSVATLPYSGAAAITEWGIFSASSVGTLWDHRVFSAINVANGDSIQFTYKLTVNNGGS